MKLTKRQFLKRITVEETAAILQISDVSPQVRVYLFKLQQAEDVDTNDPETIMGLRALEDGGYLAAGRASKILCLGYASPSDQFGFAPDARFEIVEIDPDGTAHLDTGGDTPMAFAAGNYEVVP